MQGLFIRALWPPYNPVWRAFWLRFGLPPGVVNDRGRLSGAGFRGCGILFGCCEVFADEPGAGGADHFG